jgi:cyclic nucleotide-binding protein
MINESYLLSGSPYGGSAMASIRNVFSPWLARAAALGSTARTRSSFHRKTPRMRSSTSSGKVKVTVVSEQGKEAVVAMLGTNDFFGEGCLAGQARRIATVGLRHRAPGKSGYCLRDPSGASVLRDVHCPSFGPGHPRRGRPRPGCPCCWRTLARTTRNRSRSSRKSARRRLRI